MPDRYGTRAECAERLNITERSISTLVKTGRLADGTAFPSRVQGRDRTFPLGRCLDWYIQYKIEEAIRRLVPREASSTNIADAERRKAVADAEIAEFRLAKMRGDVVPKAVFREELVRAFGRVKQRFLSVPGEYGPRVLHLEDMPAAVAVLRELVATVLAELQGGMAVPEEDGPDDGPGDGPDDDEGEGGEAAAA